jgi:hypothetical protein
MPARTAAAGSKERELTRAIDELHAAVSGLPEEYSHIFHPGRQLLFTYLRGIVSGLGALTAVAIVIPIIVTVLQQVQWVPLVGDFTERILNRIEQTR